MGNQEGPGSLLEPFPQSQKPAWPSAPFAQDLQRRLCMEQGVQDPLNEARNFITSLFLLPVIGAFL